MNNLDIVDRAMKHVGALFTTKLALKAFYRRQSDDVLKEIKEQYLESDIIMSEFLRTQYSSLSNDIKRELIKWAGEDDYVYVSYDGKILAKED